MNIEDTITGRRSVRKFIDEPVPDEIIMKLISMAINAPSPGNQQNWRFIVIKGSKLKQQMATLVKEEIYKFISIAAVNNDDLHAPTRFATWFEEAPVVLAVTTEVYRSKLDQILLAAGFTDSEVDDLRCRPDLQAIGAAVQNILLAAYALDYGTCWLTGPLIARPELEKFLDIRHPRSLAALIALGRPRANPPQPKRKPVEDYVTFI